jgi:hypothetical protein
VRATDREARLNLSGACKSWHRAVSRRRVPAATRSSTDRELGADRDSRSKRPRVRLVRRVLSRFGPLTASPKSQLETSARLQSPLPVNKIEAKPVSERPPATSAAGLDHAWKWFELHAGQRLQLVNFWLVAMAFVVAALATAFSSDLPELAAVVSLAGAVATFGFSRLELRTRRLVRLGESAVAEYEARLARDESIPELELVKAADKDHGFLKTYGSIFAVLYGFTTCAFLFTAGFAAGIWAH